MSFWMYFLERLIVGMRITDSQPGVIERLVIDTLLGLSHLVAIA